MTEQQTEQQTTIGISPIGPEALTRTVVLCPSRDGLRRPGEKSIAKLRAAGATIVRSDGQSCIAQHRCSLAAEAIRVLDTRRTAHPYWWVLHLDDDMVVTPEDVLALMHYCFLLAPQIRHRPTAAGHESYVVNVRGNELPLDADPLLHAPLVSAAYVHRTNRLQLAASLLEDEKPRLLQRWTDAESVPSEVGPQTVAVPALCGLGCALQSAPAFYDQIASSPSAPAPAEPDGLLPVAYQTCAIKRPPTADGEPQLVEFLSEDYWYSRVSWLKGRGAYVVDVPVGHVMPMTLYPDSEVFGQLFDATKRSLTSPAAEPPAPPAGAAQE